MRCSASTHSCKPTPTRLVAFAQMSGAWLQIWRCQPQNLNDLRGQVRPGFGRLTEARVQAIRNAGAESIGNLRKSLSRRGVMGSSFANDAETRTRMATGQEEERARAEAMVEEIGMSRQGYIADEMNNQMLRFSAAMGMSQEDRAILGQQAQVLAQRASQTANMMDREFNEMGLAGSFRTNMNTAISAQAIQLAQLDMLQESGNAQLRAQQAAQRNAELGLQTQLANVQNLQQSHLANATFQQQSAMANAEFNMNAQLANAGYGMQANVANARNEMGFAGLGLLAFPFEGGLTN